MINGLPDTEKVQALRFGIDGWEMDKSCGGDEPDTAQTAVAQLVSPQPEQITGLTLPLELVSLKFQFHFFTVEVGLSPLKEELLPGIRGLLPHIKI